MPVPSDQLPADERAVLSKRTCGRCQGSFDGDPDLEPLAIPEWWACATCRGVLFGSSSVLQSPET